ncbi:MAG: DUF721 domain-containing protein [Alphaproteobacteria bacterium]|nr:DUF721 domain-containing protein [Alphaproteobacteria bacterium]
MSNQTVKKIYQRTARPQTIAGAMGGLMRMFGIRASDSDLVNRWADIMGPDIAQTAVPVAIKKMRDGRFSIVLRPTNPAFTLALSYRVGEITDKINKYFGRDAVGKISFRK